MQEMSVLERKAKVNPNSQRIVPTIATYEMLVAASDYMSNARPWNIAGIYAAMLEAAPKSDGPADTVTLPKEPPEAWFRPFIMCPADEVLLAWQAFLLIAAKRSATEDDGK